MAIPLLAYLEQIYRLAGLSYLL